MIVFLNHEMKVEPSSQGNQGPPGIPGPLGPPGAGLQGEKVEKNQTNIFVSSISHLLRCDLINVCVHRAIWAQWELQALEDSQVSD